MRCKSSIAVFWQRTYIKLCRFCEFFLSLSDTICVFLFSWNLVERCINIISIDENVIERRVVYRFYILWNRDTRVFLSIGFDRLLNMVETGHGRDDWEIFPDGRRGPVVFVYESWRIVPHGPHDDVRRRRTVVVPNPLLALSSLSLSLSSLSLSLLCVAVTKRKTRELSRKISSRARTRPDIKILFANVLFVIDNSAFTCRIFIW